MPKSDLFPSLSDIVFAEKDPDTITKEIISLYEASSGRTIARADPVRLFIDAIILAIVQQRNIIDHSAKMNLLAYAEGEYLDHLGALLGVVRLEASHAVTTIRFTLKHTYSYNVVIPEGLRLSAGSLVFATTSALTIKAGTLTGDVEAQCTTAGVIGNGLVAGQIVKFVDVPNVDVKAENITTTNGGSDTESDEAFRERIQIAPESFSVAGPVKAYEYHARSANPDIIGVAVAGPPDTQPGHVNIYPLMTGGTLPGDEVLGQVLNACSASDVRPDTDYVHVLKPVQVSYALDVKFWIDAEKSSAAGIIRVNCVDAINDWITWQRSSLGRDINPSELIHRVVAAGAKRCEVYSPAFTVLKGWEVGVCTSQSVNYAGLEDA
ncbi:MAG: baseplate J/gp47 family protein [Synergistaceae bacterium]|nr:baseplate J/gp47 family protein [Synergistaceae bacterium]